MSLDVKCCQKIKDDDPSSLLSSNDATPGVVGRVLSSLLQKRDGATGESSKGS